jgi:hypothetical protein
MPLWVGHRERMRGADGNGLRRRGAVTRFRLPEGPGVTPRLRLVLTVAVVYVAIVVAVCIATRHLFVLGFLGLVPVGLLPFRRR